MANDHEEGTPETTTDQKPTAEQKRLTALEKQVADKTTALTAKDATITGLRAEVKAKDTTISNLQKQLSDKASESEAKDAIISKQEEQLAEANAQGAGALSVVTHDKQRYQVLAGQFSLDNQVIKHHELKTRPELVKRLVEEESPLLQRLEDKPSA